MKLFLFLLLSFTLSAQQIARLRFDDNFSALKNDSLKIETIDYLKEIQLGKEIRLSFGGEWREQYQSYTHFNFGEVPADFVTQSPYQLMHRTMLHANLELPYGFRVFAQLNNTERFWNPNPLSGQLDQNLLSLHQLLVDIPFSNRLKLRVGKQEYSLGVERFVATREGPNTRTPFYGVNLKYQQGNLQWDAFISHPIRIKPGVFDDEPTDEILGGLYANYRIKKRNLIEPYYFYFESDLREYKFKRGLEKRHTFGLRAFSSPGNWNYEIELASQTGQFNDLSIAAFMGVWDFNVALKKAFYVGFSGNYVPGDRSSSDGQLNTFNTLFARPPFGQTVALNITNTWNFSPYLRYQDFKNWLVTGRASFVTRESSEDGIFTPNMTPARPVLGKFQGSLARDICNIYALDAQYFPTKHFSFQLEIGYCAAGDYLKESGSGQNVHYYALRNVYRF